MTNAESPQQTATLTLGQGLKQAIAHHQAGQLQDAERLYRAILQARPNHPDANHNLGVLAVQMKRPAAGLPHFKAALEANPDQGQYWLSYIDALLQAGQSDAALQVLEQGRQRGLQGEAVEALAGRLRGEKAVMPAPVHKAAMPAKKVQRGKAALRPEQHEIEALAALCAEGRYVEAETLARSIAARYPRQGFGWKVLGVALLEQRS